MRCIKKCTGSASGEQQTLNLCQDHRILAPKLVQLGKPRRLGQLKQFIQQGIGPLSLPETQGTCG